MMRIFARPFFRSRLLFKASIHSRKYGILPPIFQVHIQTIGILVAEKSELQSSLGQSQKSAEKRLEEVEELSGRLKASRVRVTDLERNLATVSSSCQQYEKVNEQTRKLR